MDRKFVTRRNKWIKALRTGEITGGGKGVLKVRQGRNTLRLTRGTMCCLGVACEVYARATGKGKWTVSAPMGWEFVIDGEGESAVLPKEVFEWYGLKDDNPFLPASVRKPALGEFYRSLSTCYNLASLNDNGATFEQIADILAEKTKHDKRKAAK